MSERLSGWYSQACKLNMNQLLYFPPSSFAASGHYQPQEWHYSHIHNAILGPFGELMTEADLIRIEKQIENLKVMHKVEEVEGELEQLERELHQLLPVSAALNRDYFSVNPKQVHGQAEDLPEWCSKISTLLKSMAVLLATLGGKEIDILDVISPGYSQVEARNMTAGQPAPAGFNTGFIGRSQSFSTREDVEKEIKQCGVSVKNLKANYEIQNQSQIEYEKANRVYKRQTSLPVVSRPETILEDGVPSSPAKTVHFQTNGELPPVEESVLPVVEEPVIIPSHAPLTYAPSNEEIAQTNMEQFNQFLCADPILNDDQLTRSLEVQTDLSYVQECIEMRKERIVFLFLEHWRKYTISESYRPKPTGRRGNYLEVGLDDYNQFSEQVGGETQSEDDKLLLFMKSKQVVGNLIGHWRTIMSQVPTRQIRRLSRAQMMYWPEHFLPHINGAPFSYESLTLDLFMLGYFQLLEMNMSRSERKFRHLLCYEMFDRLGSHKWEVIRQFHKEVMEEIERGKRDWADGFEDIRLKYFGDSVNGAPSDVSLPPVAAQDGVHNGVQHVEQSTMEETAQRDVNATAQMSSSEPVHSNGKSAVQNSMAETAPHTEPTAKVEALQDTAGGSGPAKDVPPVTVPIVEEPHAAKPPPPREEPNEDSIKLIYELKEFSNEEIIRYIDRSFAFWKEKEAELFDI
ncbi:espin-like protein [Diretmus argenteus]